MGYDRVRAHSSEAVNERVDRASEGAVERAKRDPDFVPQRLAQLEHEWELDRAVLVAFAAMGGVALGLGLRKRSFWRFPLMAQIGAMTAHALFGWSPQAVVLRRLGFRTRQEIDTEHNALLTAHHGRTASA